MRYLLMIFILPGIFSCKKKKEEKTEEPPPVVTPTKTNSMTAKLNGNAWAVAGNLTADAKIDQGVGTGAPKQYFFTGRTTSSMYQNSIQLWTTYTTGTVSLRSVGSGAIYFDAAGMANYVKSGTMTITTIDTSHVKSPKCDKFKATFDFVTDSTGGKNYTIEQGSIDFEVY